MAGLRWYKYVIKKTNDCRKTRKSQKIFLTASPLRQASGNQVKVKKIGSIKKRKKEIKQNGKS